ncbi:MAG: hypothetical protein QM766_20655 [Burkholderiaceae bacterium]
MHQSVSTARRALLLGSCAAMLTGGCAASSPRRPSIWQGNGAPAYEPRPVAPPRQAPYLLGDGSIGIVGNDGMEALIGDLNQLFMDTHPGIRFATRLEGSSTAMPALAAGATLFAPMTRHPWPGDRDAFVQLHGRQPIAVRIAYNGHGPRPPARTPPAVYVHQTNPLAGMSLSQLAQVFTVGSPPGDILTWGQLGLRADRAERRIHVYGLRDDGGFASGARDAYFAGRPFAAHYEPLASREAVLKAVAADPFGICMLGWIDAAKVTTGVRVLALAEGTGQIYHGPALESVMRGLYPLSSPVQFLVDKPPGKPIDPVAHEYLRMALSREGQALVARQIDSEEGYVPLSTEDLAGELRHLASLS